MNHFFRVGLILGLMVPAMILQLAHATDMTFFGPGYLAIPRAVGLAPNGDVWVGATGQIAVFGADGSFKRVDSHSGWPINSIVFDAKGNPVFGLEAFGIVLTVNESEEHMTGFSAGEVVVNEKNEIFATDIADGVIKKYNALGTLVQEIKVEGTDAMKSPYGMALDAHGRIYVSDKDKPGLWVFGANGVFSQRLLPTERCSRVRRGPDGIYVVTQTGVQVLDAETGVTLRKIALPGGYGLTAFAVDAGDNIFTGSSYGDVVTKYAPDGKTGLVFGPSFKATLSVPDTLDAGATVSLPLKIEALATKPAGPVSPTWKLGLQPAILPGAPDLDWYNSQQRLKVPALQEAWRQERQVRLTAQERALAITATPDALQITVPKDIPTDVYRFVARSAAGSDEGMSEREQTVGVLQPDAKSNLTLFVPRQRSVFQPGEPIEINVILRSHDAGNVKGSLRFSLVPRKGDSLDFTPGAPPWKQFDFAGPANNTLTFHADAGGIYPGRYVLQAESSIAGTSLHDVWPLQIVSTLEATNFRILFPEWSAGYTDIWGPFTGQGMQADSAGVAHEGITLYDTEILGRGSDPAVMPSGPEAAGAQACVERAKSDAAFPAPEKFMPASPIEVEFQEALRNRLQVQRDIWGSHFLGNWGMADPLGVDRDNRIVRLWTQWQREWPSWIGHRYLALSIDQGKDPEHVALMEQWKKKGRTVPSEEDLTWVRNGGQRQFISDADAPVEAQTSSVGADGAGNIYEASNAGFLMKYAPNGDLLRKSTIPAGVIDIVVTADGTVYGAHVGRLVSVTTPDGKTTQWPADVAANSPRGIALEKAGTLLLSDFNKARVRRYTIDGKLVGDIGDANTLKRPTGITTTRDGTIYVADEGRGGVMSFAADGTPLRFFTHMGSAIFCGKTGLRAGSDDTLWASLAWTGIGHYDREGKLLGVAGREGFELGGISLPMSIAFTPGGDLLIADATLPYAQEMTQTGEPVRMFGIKSLFADVRIDRTRYTSSGNIIASVWMPISSLKGIPQATLHAFAHLTPAPSAGKEDNAQDWQSLEIKPFGGGNFAIGVPKLEGKATLRMVWAAGEAKSDNPLHADFPIEIAAENSPQDLARQTDIIEHEEAWKQAWAKTRMGTLVRWTSLSNTIAESGGHSPTQDTAPTNFGCDTLGMGVWIPYRRDALVAEAENEGHDFGTFPLMGAFYVARALEGPHPLPAWASLLQWYWRDDPNRPIRPVPTRDTIILLGAGASGMGTGMLMPTAGEPQKALHRKMVDRLHRLGDACMAMELPGQGCVAILHSFTQEAMDPANREQFYAAHAAWYDLLRLHVPCAITTEETIDSGGLIGRFKAVLLPFVQHPLPEKTLAALQQFRASGGEIWVDLSNRDAPEGAKLLQTLYWPFWFEEVYQYAIHQGLGVAAYDGNYEYWRMKQGSNDRLPALREAFDKLAAMPVATDDPDVFLQQRRGGAATYIFAANDHFPDKPLYQTHLSSDGPEPKTVNFKMSVPAGTAVYDALTMTPVLDSNVNVNFTDAEPARVWAVLPRSIEAVAVSAAASSGTVSAPDNAVSATITVLDAAGKTLEAVVPLELTLTDGAGSSQTLWRATNQNGICRLSVPLGWLAPAGVWTIAARELLSGKAAPLAKVSVGAPSAPSLAQDKSQALVFDRGAIADWLRAMKGHEVWIALGKRQTALRADADKLAQSLNGRGIQAKVINIADVPEIPLTIEYSMTTEQQTALQKVQDGQAVGMRQHSDAFRAPGPQRVVMRPLILLGNPKDNSWFKDVDNWHLTRRSPSPCYPGPGRALLQFVWTPFYDGFDALTVGAGDIEGVRAGVIALTDLDNTDAR